MNKNERTNPVEELNGVDLPVSTAVKQQVAQGATLVAERDDEDKVCFVRRNWGTPAIPENKVDYVDDRRFIGGICRDVRYGDAKKWLKRDIIGGYILDRNVSIEDIKQATGRNPDSPENIASAIHSMTPEMVLAMLGTERAAALAQDIIAQQAAQQRA